MKYEKEIKAFIINNIEKEQIINRLDINYAGGIENSENWEFEFNLRCPYNNEIYVSIIYRFSSVRTIPVINVIIDEYGVTFISGLYPTQFLNLSHRSLSFVLPPYVISYLLSSGETPEQEEETEEELTDEDLAGIHSPVDEYNEDDCVISLGINLYLPCKSRTEYEDKCIEFTKNTLNDTYNALCQIAYIVGNSLGYNLTKTDVDVRYSTTSCSPFDYYCSEQEREEETAVDLIKDRKTEYVDDYHVRFLRSEMIIIQQALHYYASNHSLHNEHKLIFEYVSKLVNMAVLREYDSAVFHVDCDPSPDDEFPF